MLELTYGHAFSNVLLFTARGKAPSDPLPTPFKRLLWKARLRRHPYPQRAFIWAQMIGTHDGLWSCQQPRTATRPSPGSGELSDLISWKHGKVPQVKNCRSLLGLSGLIGSEVLSHFASGRHEVNGIDVNQRANRSGLGITCGSEHVL